MSRFVRRSTLIVPAIALMLPVTAAHAGPVTVGSPLKGNFGGATCSGPSGTWANPVLSEPGAHSTSPVSGVIVGWKMTGNYSGGPFKLRVLRPAGTGKYTGAGSSAEVSPASGPQAYTADLPIAAGDLVALDVHEGCIGTAGVAGAEEINWNPVLPEGSTLAPPYAFPNYELGFNAEVQAPPTIAGLNVTKGSIQGGTAVTITGTDFERTSAVSFGTTPAAGFSLTGEGTITAIAPAAAGLGSVPVRVSTIAGTATSSALFTYEGCVVPKLKGKTLRAARKKLARAGCRLGKVRGPKGKTAKVRTQKPRPGAVLAPGSKVNVRDAA